MEPELFGRYILMRRLAEGGMGEVFLAQQPGIAGFAKQLVVKRMRPSLAGDPLFVEAFVNEGRVAALIDHPNVVHIHELGQVEGRYFIAMEYVHGSSLAAVLQRLGDGLELSIALYIMNNVCEGLAYAHDATGLDGASLGLVHRDISPPNILIGYSGSVKVSDFGIAKVRQHPQTVGGAVKGKFAYLSPEQARGEPVDRRSDIYALGLVLYEITVGRRANPGENDMGMAFAATRGQVPDPTEVMPGYPPPLARIFARATALEPADRHQSVKELQDDLLAFQMEEGLITSAGRVGEWLRQLDGVGEEAGQPLDLCLEGVPDAEPPQALAPTVHVSPTGKAATTGDDRWQLEGKAAVTGDDRWQLEGKAAVTGDGRWQLEGEPRQREGELRGLEVDLEQERAPWGRTPARRRSRAPLLALLGLAVLLLAGAGLVLRSSSGGLAAGDPDAGEDGVAWRADGRVDLPATRPDMGRGTGERVETGLPSTKGLAVPYGPPRPKAVRGSKRRRQVRRRARRKTRRSRARQRVPQPAPRPSPPTAPAAPTPPSPGLPDDVVPGPAPLPPQPEDPGPPEDARPQPPAVPAPEPPVEPVPGEPETP